MSKHCQSIWEQTWIISQLRVSLCFSSGSVAVAISILLVSSVERSLLLINYLVRLEHSTPRQFLFMLFFFLTDDEPAKGQNSQGNRKKNVAVAVLSFLAASTAPSSRKTNGIWVLCFYLPYSSAMWDCNKAHILFWNVPGIPFHYHFCTLWCCVQCLTFRSSQWAGEAPWGMDGRPAQPTERAKLHGGNLFPSYEF